MSDVGFGQLYYTSCERGLSGHPGYQFNAATPGVPAEVMTDVAKLTGYDAPRKLSSKSKAEEIRAAPVNLCYRPGQVTVLANVVLVGNDYSHRFGNYFVHALVTDDVDDFGAVLPIELWGAGFWSCREADGTELPPLPARPAPGVLDRRSAAHFVASHRGSHHLAALLTAVDLAVGDQERKVVIVEKDADSAARWIAAVSFLLPPAMTRRMSFATYEHQPRYSGLHVVGTLAESEVDRGAFDTYHLFDLADEETKASPIEPHPLAELLVEVGVEAAAETWRRAGELAEGDEFRLADWHAVVLASTGAGGQAGGAVVAPWLAEHSGRLGGAVVDRIGRGLDLGACTPQALAAIAEAARNVGAHTFADDAERAWVHAVFEEVFSHGGDPDGADLPLRSPVVRVCAADLLARRLPDAAHETVVNTLQWARRNNIQVDDEVLRLVGARTLGPAALDIPSAEAGQLLRDWPELRVGVTEHLASIVHTRPDVVIAVLLTDVGAELDVRQHPDLSIAAIVVDTRRGRTPRPRALAAIIGRVPLDDRLLRELWPEGRWNHHEASIILRDIEPALVAARPLISWLDAALRDEPIDAEAYDRLCTAVREHPAHRRLPAATRGQVDTRSSISTKIDQMVRAKSTADFEHQLEALRRSHGSSGPERRSTVIEMVAQRMSDLSADHFALLIIRFEDVQQAYLDDAERTLRTAPVDTHLAAELLILAWRIRTLRKGMAGASELHVRIERSTLRAIKKWRRRDLKTIATRLRSRGLPGQADWFAHWLKENGGSFIGRFLRKQLLSKGTTP